MTIKMATHATVNTVIQRANHMGNNTVITDIIIATTIMATMVTITGLAAMGIEQD
jgi:hypothetical protein